MRFKLATLSIVSILALLCSLPALRAGGDLPAMLKSDVIYGRKSGMALTMDVYTPKENANGAAVIVVLSGGWISDRSMMNNPAFQTIAREQLKRGYTVFAVAHGSQPKYTIPEAITDMHRAVRYIRHNAKEFSIDPDRIGITGGSAGGHLSLMQGTAGNAGNPKSGDVVERASSKVQAVACFFPPTDFLNYGGNGKYAFAADGLLARLRFVVDIHEFDKKTNLYERVTDEKKIEELARNVSPVSFVTKNSAPTLIIHGDKDFLVPISQAEAIMSRYKEAGVASELVVRKGRAHDFNGVDKDAPVIADWFDTHLKKK